MTTNDDLEKQWAREDAWLKQQQDMQTECPACEGKGCDECNGAGVIWL